MSLYFPLILLMLVGLVLLPSLQGRHARVLKQIFLVGLISTLGGCVGVLGWLGAETSGQDNLFHGVNPYVWSGLFSLGGLLLLVAAVGAIILRLAKAKPEA